MNTLDRYIIKQFLLNFAILFVVLISLFVVVDLIIDLDEFVQAGVAHADKWIGGRWVATVAAIVDYYTPTVILVYVFFNGLIVVGAMGFTLAHLQRTRELTAMIASGVSLYRVAAPLVVTGFVLSALTLPVQEFVLPSMAGKLVRKKSELKKERQGLAQKPVFYAPAGGGDLLSAQSFSPATGSMKGVQIHDRDEAGRAQGFAWAQGAYWRNDLVATENDQPHFSWVLDEGYVEQMPTPGVQAEPAEGGASGETVAPRGEVHKILNYETELSPTVLQARQTAMFANLLSIRELEVLGRNRAVDAGRRSKIRQIIWSRFSLMVLNGLLLVMALPFFLSRLPGNTLVASLRAAALCVGAWGGGLVMLQFSPASMPFASLASPTLVAWLPVAMYLPVAAWQLGKIGTQT